MKTKNLLSQHCVNFISMKLNDDKIKRRGSQINVMQIPVGLEIWMMRWDGKGDFITKILFILFVWLHTKNARIQIFCPHCGRLNNYRRCPILINFFNSIFLLFYKLEDINISWITFWLDINIIWIKQIYIDVFRKEMKLCLKNYYRLSSYYNINIRIR